MHWRLSSIKYTVSTRNAIIIATETIKSRLLRGDWLSVASRYSGEGSLNIFDPFEDPGPCFGRIAELNVELNSWGITLRSKIMLIPDKTRM